MTPRLVITGTRYGRPGVWDALDSWVNVFGPPRELILGGARGVDHQALEWARCQVRDGLNFPIVFERAEWLRFQKRAGPMRNLRMVQRADPGDHLLAFPKLRGDSPGTYHCHAAGLARGLLCALVMPRSRWLYELYKQHQQHPRWAA